MKGKGAAGKPGPRFVAWYAWQDSNLRPTD
jgi:hypothetical protein